MNQETIKKYQRAGKIAAKVLQYGKTLIKPGAQIKETLDKIEEKVHQLGGELAFPAQISLNETAAHACPDLNDTTILTDQVVKLDVGAHVDGYVGDNALTVDLSQKYTELVKASQEALNNALKIIAPGTTLGEVGKAIEETITSYGYKPVRNLSGHGLGHFQIHTKPSIPNFNNNSTTPLETDMAIAIEPFASTGAGMIKQQGVATVFEPIREAPVRDLTTRKIQQHIKTYHGLPFAKRWLEKKFTTPKTNFALRRLTNLNVIKAHPPLVDVENGMISQAEHSVIVQEKPIITTKI